MKGEPQALRHWREHSLLWTTGEVSLVVELEEKSEVVLVLEAKPTSSIEMIATFLSGILNINIY